MASSSSSSASNSQHCPRWKYDVFLSFRGEDTRKTFTGHLYEGLKNKGIVTFQDDKRLDHGDSIPQELLKAIEESQVALVVFSKNYATSRWCLNELVKIMECKDKNELTVIPVFYDVDPSHVRNQRESFAKAFAKHESNYKDDVEGTQKVQRWRTTLTAATNLKGYDIRQGVESENIQQIVNQISSKLCKTSVSYLQDIVGIDTYLEEVKSQLQMEINDVRILGIWGMGGIGKTTIARAIFDTLSYQFEAACFIADIKENKCGMHSLQNILLSELLRKKDNYVNNKEDGKHMIARRLRFKKVLVVLDDVDHIDHLDYLAGNLNWYGSGSRIIATTRDKHLIRKNDIVYEVTTLVDHEAIKLFNQYAFRKEVPDECFKKLSLEVVRHANGLPLALKVWGSLLHNRDLTEWRSAIEAMKINSKLEIVEKLKVSYDRLETIQQDIFLDIACFLRGKRKDYIMPILESCYSGANIELSVLIDKSLVFISNYDTIQMHDLIQDMGKYIEMQKDPGERSRIWDAEDFKEVMVNNSGTKTVEAIWIHGVQKLCFSKKVLKNMKKLRILYIDNIHTHADFIEYLPNNLLWFECHKYPWRCLPESFEPTRIVHLDLKYSSLCHLWIGTKVASIFQWTRKLSGSKKKLLLNEPQKKHLASLRTLDLGYSKRLIRTPDFTGMSNLKSLNLCGCISLAEVHHSLGCCKKLKWLYLQECRSLVALPSSICKLKSLVKLDVSFCSKLEDLPEEIGDLENLEWLEASGTLISRPPSSIVRLNKLKFLSFEKRKSENGVYFVFPQVNEGLRSLEELNLKYCNLIDGGLPEDIGYLSSLKELYLNYCNLIDGGLPEDIGCSSFLKELRLDGNNFEYLPRSIAQLGALRSLHLRDCKRLKHLPEFPDQLDKIDADWSNDWICNSLFQNISSLQHDISASDYLSLRVFTSWWPTIPSWFHHQGNGISVKLPENWYVSDNFLGFAVCYYGKINDTTACLIPLCSDGVSWMSQKLALSNHSEELTNFGTIHFFLVPLSGLWDTSKANGRTPNDYGVFCLLFGEMKHFGLRLLYKDEPELETERCISF